MTETLRAPGIVTIARALRRAAKAKYVEIYAAEMSQTAGIYGPEWYLRDDFSPGDWLLHAATYLHRVSDIPLWSFFPEKPLPLP